MGIKLCFPLLRQQVKYGAYFVLIFGLGCSWAFRQYNSGAAYPEFQDLDPTQGLDQPISSRKRAVPAHVQPYILAIPID